MSHKNKKDKPNQEDITWRIIHKNIRYNEERKCIEAIEIPKTFRGDNERLYWESDQYIMFVCNNRYISICIEP